MGGAGDVGALIVPLLSEHHDVVIADIRRPSGFACPFIELDVNVPETLHQACRGADAVVYLAMGPKSDWGSLGWARSQFDVSVTGLYSALRVAIAEGVGRFVHASTASVFDDYLHSPLPPEGDAVDAYGLSKALGEKVCRAALQEHPQVQGISLRLVGPMSDAEWHAFEGPARDFVTAGTDVARCFLYAIDRTPPTYSAVMVSGDHTNELVDSSEAERLLGWRPLARRVRHNMEGS